MGNHGWSLQVVGNFIWLEKVIKALDKEACDKIPRCGSMSDYDYGKSFGSPHEGALVVSEHLGFRL